MFDFSLERLIYVIPAVIIALTFHEYAHGWVAKLFHDPTAEAAGRLSLNPLKHLDPIGTLLLIFVGFGWAKPVPINPFYFQGNRKKKMMLVALAGPLANLVEALIGAIGLSLIWHFAPYGTITNYFYNFFYYFMYINVVLAIFNLVPVPPLDGSKILAGLLPDKCLNFIIAVERYGFIILLALVLFDIIQIIIVPPINFIVNLLLKITLMA